MATLKTASALTKPSALSEGSTSATTSAGSSNAEAKGSQVGENVKSSDLDKESGKLEEENSQDDSQDGKTDADLLAASKAKGDLKKKKKAKPQHLLFCTSKCRYNVIKKAVKQLGYKLTDDESADWDIYWNDT